METKVQTVPDVISPRNPQEEPNFYRPSRITELTRDSSNYYPQLAQYKQLSKQEERDAAYSAKKEAHHHGEAPVRLGGPIQSDLQQSTIDVLPQKGEEEEGQYASSIPDLFLTTPTARPTTTTSMMSSISTFTTFSSSTTVTRKPTRKPSKEEINFKKRLSANIDDSRPHKMPPHVPEGDINRHRDIFDRHHSLQGSPANGGGGGHSHGLHNNQDIAAVAAATEEEGALPFRQHGNIPGLELQGQVDDAPYIVRLQDQLHQEDGDRTLSPSLSPPVQNAPPASPNIRVGSVPPNDGGDHEGNSNLRPTVAVPAAPERIAAIPIGPHEDGEDGPWSWDGFGSSGFNGGEHHSGRDKFDFRPPPKFAIIVGNRWEKKVDALYKF